MRPLVAVRRAAPYDPHFLARDPRFWPLARAVRALTAFDDFPPVDALGRVFDGEPPVRFVAAAPRRNRRSPVDPEALYDARIALGGVVPTRAGCWHDLMNALVWGTFPRAKLALHARQHRAIARRLAPDARTLPPARTPELDALALLDEGGVLLLVPASVDSRPRPGGAGDVPSADALPPAQRTILFGHAIYESLALGVRPAVAAAMSLAIDLRGSDVLRAVDGALARCIEDATTLAAPSVFRRVSLAADGPIPPSSCA